MNSLTFHVTLYDRDFSYNTIYKQLRDFVSILQFTEDENWPYYKFPKSNSHEQNQSQRRRLNSNQVTDRWKAEEEEMLNKIMLLKNKLQPSNQNTITIYNNKNVDTYAQKVRRTQADGDDDGFPPISKTCTEPQDPVVPCPPTDLAQKCDKYNGGRFSTCFNACKPSVCCTHDSKRTLTPSCAETAVNCQHWIPCYIVWWKLADTVGPADVLRLGGDDAFFDTDTQTLKEELNNGTTPEFYAQWFQRFIDDDTRELDEFSFENEALWEPISNGYYPDSA